MTALETIRAERRWMLWAAFACVLVAAAALRLYEITGRPLHNDEGVNFFFLEGIKRLGYYQYSHENYHGPSYFYFTALFNLPAILAAAGPLEISELALRSSAIFFGILCIVLLLLLRRSQGWAFVLIGGAVVALSSSLTFYSRYAIHESLFLFAGAWLGISLYLWWENGRARWLYPAAAALGLLIATKETFIITLFCLFCGFAALGDYRRVILQLRAEWRHVVQALFLMLLVVFFFFTGGFQWAGGLREMLLAVPQWIGRNQSDVGHFKSFWYYTDMLLGPELRSLVTGKPDMDLGRGLHIAQGAEPQLAFALLIPLAYLVCMPRQFVPEVLGRKGAFFRFTIAWGLSAYLAYSLVNYKTPWLAINITFPLSLCLAWSLARLFQYPWYGRWIGAAACLAVFCLAAQREWKYNFQLPYGNGNPYSYVHTRQGMLQLVNDIKVYREKNPRARVLVGVGSYWPLPYYLRQMQPIGYENLKEPEKRMNEYDVLILDSGISWNNPNWARKYYRLSDVQESYTYYRRSKTPAEASK